MNPLTQIKNTQKATQREVQAGISDSASWHARFKHSAYVFVGGLDYDLTEGDLLAVFSQYGEVVDLNLVRDKDTGKSKGFAFLAYEDQRSTVLAVDNLSGAKVVGRTIRVEHVDNYKKRKAELEGGDPDAEDANEEGPEPGSRDANPAAARGGRRDDDVLGGPGPPRRGRSPPVAAKAPGGPPSSEPWAAPGSIFSLLDEARQIQAAKQGSRKQDTRSRGEQGGSGKDAGGKSNGRGRDDVDPSPGREHERSNSAGPSGPRAFGPPRPPQRPPGGGGPSDGAPGPGPGSSRGRDGRHEGDQREDRSRREGGEREEPYGCSERDGARDRRRGGRSPSPDRRSPRRDYEGGRERGGATDQRGGPEPSRNRDRGAEWDRDRDRARDWERGRDRSRSREREADRHQKGSDRDRWRDRER